MTPMTTSSSLRELYIRSFPNNAGSCPSADHRLLIHPVRPVDRSSRLTRLQPPPRPDGPRAGQPVPQRGAEDVPERPGHCVPDIVLTLDVSAPDSQRHGALLVLRDDQERSADQPPCWADRRVGCAGPGEFQGHARRRRTPRGRRGAVPPGGSLVRVPFRRGRGNGPFAQGMIFAVVTNTPCVALDSRTGKVGQFYRDWLKGHPGVFLIQSPDSTAITRNWQDNCRALKKTRAGGSRGRWPKQLAGHSEAPTELSRRAATGTHRAKTCLDLAREKQSLGRPVCSQRHRC